MVVAVGDTFDILDPTDLTDTSNPLFFVPMGADEPSDYIGYLLYNETLNQFRTVNSYDNTTGLLTVDAAAPVGGWLPTHNYSIRKQPPVLVSVAAVGSTNTQVVFGAGAGTVDNLYNGWFIRTPRAVYDNNVVPPQGEQRRIIAYDGVTLTATVSPAFTATTLGSTVELLQFSYDNMYPFPFRATLQQEIPTYSIDPEMKERIAKLAEADKKRYHTEKEAMQKKDNKNDNHLKSKYLYFCKEERDKNSKIALRDIAVLWASNKNDDKLDERYRAAKLAVAADRSRSEEGNRATSCYN